MIKIGQQSLIRTDARTPYNFKFIINNLSKCPPCNCNDITEFHSRTKYYVNNPILCVLCIDLFENLNARKYATNSFLFKLTIIVIAKKVPHGYFCK